MADVAPAPGQAGSIPAGAGQQQGGGSDAFAKFQDMVVQVARGLDVITSFIGKASPEAGKTLAEATAVVKKTIEAVMSGGGEGEAPAQAPRGAVRAAPQMVSPETHGKPATQAL